MRLYTMMRVLINCMHAFQMYGVINGILEITINISSKLVGREGHCQRYVQPKEENYCRSLTEMNTLLR